MVFWDLPLVSLFVLLGSLFLFIYKVVLYSLVRLFRCGWDMSKNHSLTGFPFLNISGEILKSVLSAHFSISTCSFYMNWREMGHASLVKTYILIRFHCRENVQKASKAIRQRIMSLCIFKRVDYMDPFSRWNSQKSPWRKIILHKMFWKLFTNFYLSSILFLN